jgi:hypothetical protein
MAKVDVCQGYGCDAPVSGRGAPLRALRQGLLPRRHAPRAGHRGDLRRDPLRARRRSAAPAGVEPHLRVGPPIRELPPRRHRRLRGRTRRTPRDTSRDHAQPAPLPGGAPGPLRHPGATPVSVQKPRMDPWPTNLTVSDSRSYRTSAGNSSKEPPCSGVTA